MTIERVGFAGVGHMGGGLAEAILGGGYDLMVYDLLAEPLNALRARGAKVAADPAELGAHAQLLGVSIAGDDAIESALFGERGIAAALAPDSIIALHSTMHPATVVRIAKRVEPRGVHVIDAPVSGGRRGAAEGSLCYMIGGDAEIVERVRPVFALSGSSMFHMGALGSGTVTKIAQQMMTTINIMGIDEGTRLAAAYGIDRRRFLEVAGSTSGQSRLSDTWMDGLRVSGPAMANSFFTSLIPALELAGDLDVPIPGTALGQQRIRSIFSTG